MQATQFYLVAKPGTKESLIHGLDFVLLMQRRHKQGCATELAQTQTREHKISDGNHIVFSGVASRQLSADSAQALDSVQAPGSSVIHCPPLVLAAAFLHRICTRHQGRARTAVLARVDLLLAAPPLERAIVLPHAAPLAMVRLQALPCTR